jgi:hypothetical protein
MNQSGGSAYPTSTSTARASVFNVFSTARFILSFLLFLQKEIENGIEFTVQFSFYFSVCQNFEEEMKILYCNASMKS